MMNGDKINITENRSVLHTALRRSQNDKLVVDGSDIMPEVHDVLQRVKKFSDQVRSKLLIKIN